jgi:hypothetical protein
LVEGSGRGGRGLGRGPARRWLIYCRGGQWANCRCEEEGRRFAKQHFQLNIYLFFGNFLNKILSFHHNLFFAFLSIDSFLSVLFPNPKQKSCGTFETFDIYVLSKFIYLFDLNIVSFF